MPTHTYAGSPHVAETLRHLAEAVQPPEVIDQNFEAYKVAARAFVMTSMGNKSRALFTPYYNGFQFDNNLSTRFQRALALGRPLAEGVLSYSKAHAQAAVTLRICQLLRTGKAIETSWLYQLGEEAETAETTQDIVDAVQAVAADGAPIKGRSGIVHVTKARLEAGNWSISHEEEPNIMAAEIHEFVTDRLAFTRLN